MASSTFHLHVRAQVRSKTPRVETSVVIANQHPQLPKKLNFVFVVVARMPPPRTPSNKVGFIRFVFLLVRLCESTLHWKGRGEEGGEVKFLGEWITFLVRAEAGGCSPESGKSTFGESGASLGRVWGESVASLGRVLRREGIALSAPPPTSQDFVETV